VQAIVIPFIFSSFLLFMHPIQIAN
jgi:hypothetical protein